MADRHNPRHAAPTTPIGLAPADGRTKLIAAALTLGLIGTSSAIWMSPDARHGLAEKVLATAPLPSDVKKDILDTVDKAGPRKDTTEPADLTEAAQTFVAALKAGNTAEAAKVAPLLATALESPEGRALLRAAGIDPDADPSQDNPVKVSTQENPDTKPDGNSGEHATKPAKPTKPTKPSPTWKHCWDFTYQQDAQAYYAADPSDPWGLDGAPGPRNDDGLACTDLPVDPHRAKSTPVWPKVEPLPDAPEMAAVINPGGKYFGVYTEQAPFNMAEVNLIQAKTGHVPSSISFFSGFDQKYRSDAVAAAWKRGMFPIVSWESRPMATSFTANSNNSVNPEYALANIINGKFDDYIRSYARDIRKLGLPVGIRFDHEMNGFWYPWAEQANGNKPGEYIAAWRHVHDLFAAEGAKNVVWIWSPNTVQFPQAQPLEQLYPGDDYVDWVGFVGYYRKVIAGKEATFENTFGQSLEALKAVAPRKPVYLSEIGCTETGGNKVAWIKSLFASLAQHPEIIGFSWFDMTITAIPLTEKLPVTNDWRIDSTQGALAAFKEGLSSGGFVFGTGGSASDPGTLPTPQYAPVPGAADPAGAGPVPGTPTTSATPKATPTPTAVKPTSTTAPAPTVTITVTATPTATTVAPTPTASTTSATPSTSTR